MVEIKPPYPRQFVAFRRLSLVCCTSTEPTSVSPADVILVGCSIIVKFLFLTMPAFRLYELSRRRADPDKLLEILRDKLGTIV